jgi:hypothetical protein
MLVKINIFRLKQNKPVVGWRDLISSTVRFAGARDFKGDVKWMMFPPCVFLPNRSQSGLDFRYLGRVSDFDK